MKTSLLTPPVIVPVAQFNTYSTSWVTVVDNPDSAALVSSFTLPDKSQASYVSLPLQSLVGLCSAVGSTLIKTRFLVQANGRFTLGLCATDANGIQLTAYYLADDQVAVPHLENIQKMAQDPSGEVPLSLADYWVALWAQNAGKLTAHQFASNYGHVRGFTFDHDDFVDTLAKVKAIIPAPGSQPQPEPRLRIKFGLHEYVRPDQTTADLSFGLILQLVTPVAVAGTALAAHAAFSVGADPSGDPFFDMSQPCPPRC